MDSYDHMAELLKAIAHPLRLRILDVLRLEGEACVCHLESHLGERQAIISQQLARLRQSGLVTDRRDGMNVYYAVANDAAAPLLDAAQLVMKKEWGLSSKPAGTACNCPRCQAKLPQSEAYTEMIPAS